MNRTEQFAFGSALVTSALAFILVKSLAWLVVIIGLGLIADFYLRDLIWGSDRLTRQEIEVMPAEEYKRRVLGNPRTERWVNWRLSGYDAFEKQMRRLARQAVVFMLITPILAFASRYAFIYHIVHKSTFVASRVPSNDPWAVVAMTPAPTIELLRISLPYLAWGVPAGLALWVLFRAVVFAIKG